MTNNASIELKPVIVVVDDEPQIGQMLTKFLSKHNYEAILFTNGKEALAHLINVNEGSMAVPLSGISAKGGSASGGLPTITGSNNTASNKPRCLPKTSVDNDLYGRCLLLTDLPSEASALASMVMPDKPAGSPANREMTGLELVRQVKKLYPELPIIVMSGSADGRDRDEMFSLGIDFIPKPFKLVDLLKRIVHQLRPAERDSQTILRQLE